MIAAVQEHRQPTPQFLTERQIRLALSRVAAGENFDKVVTPMIFGGPPPLREWPAVAWEAWKAAMRAYDERFLSGEPVRTYDTEPPTLEESWTAFDAAAAAVAGERDEWWKVPRLRWRDVAEVLGSSRARSVSYHFQTIGWTLEGVFVTRHVVTAPCILCGERHPAQRIRDRLGACCRRKARG